MQSLKVRISVGAHAGKTGTIWNRAKNGLYEVWIHEMDSVPYLYKRNEFKIIQ